ncbi:MAG: serine hydrolase [Deinococcales bacterium]
MPDLTAQIAALEFSGTIGFYAQRDDGLAFGYNELEIFPAASIIKLHLLIVALQEVERGALRLETRIALPQEEIVAGSGILQKLEVGALLTLRDYLTLMIIVSDNTATNMVIDVLGGREKINAQLETWGLGATRVIGKLMLPIERKNPDQLAGKLAEIKPKEVVQVLAALHSGKLLGAEMTTLAFEILGKQEYTEMIGRLLPEGVKTATKSGQIMGVRNDVGLVQGKNHSYVVALCSKGCTDPRYHIDNEGVWALAKLSKIIYDTMQ